MPRLTKAEILATADRPALDPVAIPEWDGGVGGFFVKVLTGKERDSFEGAWNKTPYLNIRALLVQLALVDENGKHIFEATDREAVGALSSITLDRIWHQAIKHNRIGARDVEDMGKA